MYYHRFVDLSFSFMKDTDMMATRIYFLNIQIILKIRPSPKTVTDVGKIFTISVPNYPVIAQRLHTSMCSFLHCIQTNEVAYLQCNCYVTTHAIAQQYSQRLVLPLFLHWVLFIFRISGTISIHKCLDQFNRSLGYLSS